MVALDSDFLTSGPAAARYAKDFASRRQVQDPAALERDGMSRLYAVDTMPTATSTVADHRLAASPTGVAHFAQALAARLGLASSGAADGDQAAWVEEVAADLKAHAGRSLVIAGDHLDPEVHTLVCAINSTLGNIGTTVTYSDPVEAWPAGGVADQAASFAELYDDMVESKVDTLIMLGVNPVYGAAADHSFAAALMNVRLRIHHGLYVDETAEHCQWHIPAAHYLEHWSDSRAYDGTATIGQPLVEPLYAGKSELAIISALLGRPFVADDELMREHWQGLVATGGGSFDQAWRRIVHDGMVADSALPAREVALAAGAGQAAAEALAGREAQGLELAFRPDPNLFDGRYANNAWLQECPRPVTKLTWDNALMMSPRTAREHGLGDLVEGNDQSKQAPLVNLTVGGSSLEVPVWVVPGHADGALTLHLGYGRTRGGQVADGSGFNACQVRTSDAPWSVSTGVDFQPTGGTYALASTQDHHSMEGRHLVRMTDRESYLLDPEHAGAQKHHGPTDISLMTARNSPTTAIPGA